MKLLLAAVAIAVGGDGLPVKSPSAVGMSAARLATIDRVVRRGMSAGGYPGAAVVVGRKGYAVWEKGFGYLDWTRKSEVSATETIYDLASLTKVVGTTTAIMVLYDEGRIDLDAPVKAYLPEFSGGLKDSVTIRQLLTHRSGLPASRDIWRIAHSPAEARAAVLATPLASRPGAVFEYSDIGADVLGFVAETVSGQPLDQFLQARVFGPLGMTSTFYRPSSALRDKVAPTEIAPPRGYPLRGEVHDENAYALGGVAGHAGLFSTAADLSIFAQMMLNGGDYNGVRIVSDSTVKLFTRRAAGSRGLGWAIAEGQWGSGRYLSETAYGHVGYTGTSLWIDPEREMFVVLLTNRVHAARARRPAKVIADVRADLADAASVAVMDGPYGVLAMPASFRADRADGWNPAKKRVVKKRSSKSKKAVSSKRTSSRGKASASKKRTSSKVKAASSKAGSSKQKSPAKSTAKKTAART
ncbi:MAG TPA: serine hydrolase [Gemmatimonadaceae bacterium]|nr:serine hydrolase [Gemmatimonadaceae bacterium]